MTPTEAALFVYKVLLVLPEVEELSANVYNFIEGCKIWFIFKNNHDTQTGLKKAMELGGNAAANPELPFSFQVTAINEERNPNMPEFDDGYWDFLLHNEPDIVVDQEWPDFPDDWEEPFPVKSAVEPALMETENA